MKAEEQRKRAEDQRKKAERVMKYIFQRYQKKLKSLNHYQNHYHNHHRKGLNYSFTFIFLTDFSFSIFSHSISFFLMKFYTSIIKFPHTARCLTVLEQGSIFFQWKNFCFCTHLHPAKSVICNSPSIEQGLIFFSINILQL